MAETSPNILWICTDQQRFDTLGCYGNEFVDTPHIDRLAERGVQFNNCYSQSPVCTPSRASFLSSRYPRTTGCRQNGQKMPDDEVLVTTRLSESGYTCGLSGKFHLAPCNPGKSSGHPMMEERGDDGYVEFHWSHHPGHNVTSNEYIQWLREEGVDPAEHSYIDGGTGARRFDLSEEVGGVVADSDYVQISLPPDHHQTTWCAEKAITFIRENEGRDPPWLFSVNPFDPHHAFNPPWEYLEPYLDDLDDIPLPDYVEGELENKPPYQENDHHGASNTDGYYSYSEMSETDHRLIRAAYWAMIDLIDDQVGRMLDALDETGQRDETLVIFTSDHGEMLGDHGIYLKGPYFYEEAIRVPLVVSQPGTISEGVESDDLVELIDIVPTPYDATGIEPHPGVQGRSLWPLLDQNAAADGTHRESVYCEYYNAMPYHNDFETRPNGTMIRTDGYKLVEWNGLSGELYDLTGDGDEVHNRWSDPDYRDVKVELLDTMHDRMAETVDPLPERHAPW